MKLVLIVLFRVFFKKPSRWPSRTTGGPRSISFDETIRVKSVWSRTRKIMFCDCFIEVSVFTLKSIFLEAFSCKNNDVFTDFLVFLGFNDFPGPQGPKKAPRNPKGLPRSVLWFCSWSQLQGKLPSRHPQNHPWLSDWNRFRLEKRCVRIVVSHVRLSCLSS